MIALDVIVRDEFADEHPKMILAQRNHASQTLGLDRTHEALRVMVLARMYRSRYTSANA
jgi:hypothetical protein